VLGVAWPGQEAAASLCRLRVVCLQANLLKAETASVSKATLPVLVLVGVHSHVLAVIPLCDYAW
jgi:hypothetical protein